MTSKVTGEGAAADDDGDDVKKKCLNVRQKLGTWKFFNVFLRSNVTYSHSHSLSLSHSLTLSHSHTLSISH